MAHITWYGPDVGGVLPLLVRIVRDKEVDGVDTKEDIRIIAPTIPRLRMALASD